MTFLLSSENVYAYLAESGVCEASTFGEAELKMAKNFNLLLTLKDQRKVLVKQERHSVDGKTVGEFRNEWRIHQFVNQFEALHPLRSQISEAVHYDEERSIIVFNYLDHYRDLMDFYSKENQFPIAIAALLGSTLAKIHRATFDHTDYQTFLNTDTSSMFSLANSSHQLRRITPEVFGLYPDTGMKFFVLYQQFESLDAAISSLLETYESRCLIHNDLSLNNVLVSEDQGSIRLIDWERALWGDPAADVGNVIGGYLHIWLNSLVVSASMSINESLSLAVTPLDTIQPSLAALFRAYLTEFPEWLEQCPNVLPRIVQFAGLSLIQRIQAGIQYQKTFNNAGIATLQVAKTLLCRPDSAIATIFGASEIDLLSVQPSPV
jgi:thiamine kinase-like enzyme